MLKKLLILITALCLMSSACTLQSHAPTPDDNHMNHVSPDLNGDIVYFFKKGTNADQINEFGEKVIGQPHRSGNGYWSLPGMKTFFAININGFDGGSINFQPDATAEQKAFVRDRISGSDLIFRVYDNVVPNRITDLPASPDMRSSPKPANVSPAPTREPNRVIFSSNGK